MKQASNRKQVDTLYILGAGASYALSYVSPRGDKPGVDKIVRSITPLDKNFIKSLQEAKPSTGWRKNSTELIFSDWLDRTNILENGLEAAIIRRFSQFEFLSNFQPTRIRNKAKNSDYLNHLTHLICEYLKRCKSNASGDTKRLVSKIFPVGTPVEDYNNRIITFNYDTLIDRQLLDRGISRKKIYFDGLVKSKGDGVKRASDEKFPHPLVLKLHGSINWRCERAHFDKFIFGGAGKNEKFEIWQDDEFVPKPDDGDSPLIIPPIPNKPITASTLFNFLWTCAYEYMHEAKKIVIVGYSCPHTDTLASTMFGQFSSRKIEEIFVVDPNAVALKNYREMMDPRVAGRAKWRYYSNFREYIHGELI